MNTPHSQTIQALCEGFGSGNIPTAADLTPEATLLRTVISNLERTVNRQLADSQSRDEARRALNAAKELRELILNRDVVLQ
jgi:hypothetical protein